MNQRRKFERARWIFLMGLVDLLTLPLLLVSKLLDLLLTPVEHACRLFGDFKDAASNLFGRGKR